MRTFNDDDLEYQERIANMEAANGPDMSDVDDDDLSGYNLEISRHPAYHDYWYAYPWMHEIWCPNCSAGYPCPVTNRDDDGWVADDDADEDANHVRRRCADKDSITNEQDDDATDPENDSISTEEVSHTFGSSFLSASKQMGLLSLPPELRVMIYQKVLVRDHPIEAYFQDFPPLLNTCKQLREEALHVMMTKNTFFLGNHNPSPKYSNTKYTEVRDMVRNVYYEVYYRCAWCKTLDDAIWRFLDTIRDFGSPAIVRDTITIVFKMYFKRNSMTILLWFARAMRAFTNFRTVRLEFKALTENRGCRARRFRRHACRFHEHYLAPWFGPAETFPDGFGLEFHPQRFRESLPKVDWAENLDGIRLLNLHSSPNADN
ncbi:hypothetical protein MMC07_001101 [Pseudocyphellaria aurata]|nr:hypothetical protein [Pseudocyphellaria aurata]